MYKLLRLGYRAINSLGGLILPEAALNRFQKRALALGSSWYPERILPEYGTVEGLAPGQSQELFLPTIPAWAIEEMTVISEYDSELHPDGEAARSMIFNNAANIDPGPGIAYFSLIERVQVKPDVVILVPWLKTGGADLGAIYFANALSQEFGKRVLVISTEAADSPWKDRLDSSVDFLEIGSTIKDLYVSQDRAFSAPRIVLLRLLLQLRPSVVHLQNSPLGWELMRYYAKPLSRISKIYASLYCDDMSRSGQLVGYAQSYLRESHAYLERVFTDNLKVIDRWRFQFGVKRELFRVINFPSPTAITTPVAVSYTHLTLPTKRIV